MKKLVGVVVILAALILGGYYVMGIVTEGTIKKNVQRMNQNNGMKVLIDEYNRGWFKSRAKFNWTLQIPERVMTDANGQKTVEPAQTLNSTNNVTIYHGPVIFHKGVHFGLGYAQTDFPLPDQYHQEYRQFVTPESGEPHFDLSLFVNYLNNTKLKLIIPAFNAIVKEDNTHIEWLGMDSAVSVNSDGDKMSGDITLEGLRLNKKDTQINTGEVTTEYNLHKTDLGFYVGDASLSIPSVSIKNNNQDLFKLDDLEVYTSSDVDKDLFNSHFKASLDKLITNNQTYGPGNIEMAIRNLDANILAKVSQVVQSTQQASEQEKQQALMAILPDLPKIFTRGAEFEVSEMSFSMPEGRLEGNLTVNLPQGQLSSPLELLQKVQGNGKLKLPAEVLKRILTESNKQKVLSQAVQQEIVAQMQQQQAQDQQAGASTSGNATTTAPATTNTLPSVAQQVITMTNQQIASMVQSGLLIQQGSDYMVEFTLDKGQFTVNGKPFNPAMLKL